MAPTNAVLARFLRCMGLPSLPLSDAARRRSGKPSAKSSAHGPDASGHLRWPRDRASVAIRPWPVGSPRCPRGAARLWRDPAAASACDDRVRPALPGGCGGADAVAALDAPRAGEPGERALHRARDPHPAAHGGATRSRIAREPLRGAYRVAANLRPAGGGTPHRTRARSPLPGLSLDRLGCGARRRTHSYSVWPFQGALRHA